MGPNRSLLSYHFRWPISMPVVESNVCRYSYAQVWITRFTLERLKYTIYVDSQDPRKLTHWHAYISLGKWSCWPNSKSLANPEQRQSHFLAGINAYLNDLGIVCPTSATARRATVIRFQRRRPFAPMLILRGSLSSRGFFECYMHNFLAKKPTALSL